MRLVAAIAVLAVMACGASALAQTDPTANRPDPAITDGSAQKALDSARAKWKAAHIRNYDFRGAISCFCAPAYRKARTLKVRGGAPVHPPDNLRNVASVPRIFHVIQQAIDEKVASLQVTYVKRGFPRSVWIDRSRQIADEEVSYSFDRFKPRK
jgi:hypothetical protein